MDVLYRQSSGRDFTFPLGVKPGVSGAGRVIGSLSLRKATILTAHRTFALSSRDLGPAVRGWVGIVTLISKM